MVSQTHNSRVDIIVCFCLINEFVNFFFFSFFPFYTNTETDVSVMSSIFALLVAVVGVGTDKPIRLVGIASDVAPIGPHGPFGADSVCGWNASECLGGFPVVMSWVSEFRKTSRGVVQFSSPDTMSRTVRAHPDGYELNYGAWSQWGTEFVLMDKDYPLNRAITGGTSQEMRKFFGKSTIDLIMSNYPLSERFAFMSDRSVTHHITTVDGVTIGILSIWERHDGKIIQPVEAKAVLPYLTSDLREAGCDLIVAFVLGSSNTRNLIFRYADFDLDIVVTSITYLESAVHNNTAFHFFQPSYKLLDLQLYPPNGSFPTWTSKMEVIDLDVIPTWHDPAVFQQGLAWIQNEFDKASRNNFAIGSSSGVMELSQFRHPDRTLNAPCRERECMMGTLSTDAIREWVQTEIAVMNGGGYRGAGWDVRAIHRDDIWSSVPFGELICKINVTGPALMRILDHGLSFLQTDGLLNQTLSAGAFLQASGLRYRYNTLLPVGQRIVSVEVFDKETSTFLPLSRRKIYAMATSEYLIQGGDDYGEFMGDHVPGSLDCESTQHDRVIESYLTNNNPYEPHLSGSSLRVTEGTYLNLLNKTAEDCDQYSTFIPQWSDCEPCPEGSWSPLSTMDECILKVESSDDDATLLAVILSCVAGFIVLLGIPVLWKLTETHRKLSKLYNTNKIAEECSLAVVELRLSDLDYLNGLENPNVIQAAFIKIVKQMKYYMDFMPKSLLAAVHDDDDDNIDGCESASSTAPTQTTASGIAEAPVHSRRQQQVNYVKSKRITIVCINSKDHLLGLKDQENFHSKYLEKCNFVIDENGGVIQSISGDRVIAGWNTQSDRLFHTRLAASASYQLVQELKRISVSAHIGISAGMAKVGLFGAAGVRQFDNLSVIVPQASILMLLNKTYGTNILLPNCLSKELTNFHLQTIDFVQYTKLPATSICSLVGPIKSTTTEWMYALHDEETRNPFVEMNDAWALFLQTGEIHLDEGKLSGRLLNIKSLEHQGTYIAPYENLDIL